MVAGAAGFSVHLQSGRRHPEPDRPEPPDRRRGGFRHSFGGDLLNAVRLRRRIGSSTSLLMEGNIILPTPETVARAAELLRAGDLVAFPTETVYGLGSDATSDTAVAA